MAPSDMGVEVVYVPLGDAAVFHETHAFYAGMTVLDALEASQLFQIYPETRGFAVGVFAEEVALDKVLAPGMRVEVYQPLQGSPKEKRRKRAQAP